MQNHEIKLIDSTYGVEDAREILISLLNDKIKFLHLKTFSDYLRFGSGREHFEKRINELKDSQNMLRSLFNNPDLENAEIEIDCTISLKVKQPALAR